MHEDCFSRLFLRPRIPVVPSTLSIVIAWCFVIYSQVAQCMAAAGAPSSPVASGVRNYHFDKTMTREVLENYLSRSISMEGVFNGRGDLDDNIRMIKSIGAKYIGRSLCLWNGEANFMGNIERAKQQVAKALAADAELILEACVFETVSPGVEQIPIPDWVFTALSQPVEKRNFNYTPMIYAAPEQRRPMGRNAQVPDESRIETQLWFFYQAATYSPTLSAHPAVAARTEWLPGCNMR